MGVVSEWFSIQKAWLCSRHSLEYVFDWLKAKFPLNVATWVTQIQMVQKPVAEVGQSKITLGTNLMFKAKALGDIHKLYLLFR